MAEWIFWHEQGCFVWLGPDPGQIKRTPLPPKSHLSQEDALLLDARRVPPAGAVSDTIRQMRLALLSD